MTRPAQRSTRPMSLIPLKPQDSSRLRAGCTIAGELLTVLSIMAFPVVGSYAHLALTGHVLNFGGGQ